MTLSLFTRQAPATLTPQGAWMENGLCTRRTPELFENPLRQQEAKALCKRCPVLTECRAWVMDVESGQDTCTRNGVVAALTTEERAALDPVVQKRRARAAEVRKAKAEAAAQQPPAEQPLAPKTDPDRRRPSCGTENAYRWHKSRNEPIDRPCLDAHNASTKQKRQAAQEQKVRGPWQQGLTDQEIAAATGLTRIVVKRSRERLGLAENSPRRRSA